MRRLPNTVIHTRRRFINLNFSQETVHEFRSRETQVIGDCLLLAPVLRIYNTTAGSGAAAADTFVSSGDSEGELRVSISLVVGPGTNPNVRFIFPGFRRGEHRQASLRLYVDAVARAGR